MTDAILRECVDGPVYGEPIFGTDTHSYGIDDAWPACLSPQIWEEWDAGVQRCSSVTSPWRPIRRMTCAA